MAGTVQLRKIQQCVRGGIAPHTGFALEKSLDDEAATFSASWRLWVLGFPLSK